MTIYLLCLLGSMFLMLAASWLNLYLYLSDEESEMKEIFECGFDMLLPSSGPKFSLRLYGVGVIFLILDIEVIILFFFSLGYSWEEELLNVLYSVVLFFFVGVLALESFWGMMSWS